MSLTETTRGIGDNLPPDPAALLAEQLAETHAPLIKRKDELLGMEERLPAACTDEDTAAKLADAIKACTAFTKNSESTRLAANEPFRLSIRTVDGFFKAGSDAVDRLKTKMGAMLTAYQRDVADKERRRLEAIAAEERRVAQEAEKKAREEARIAREAREAEERRAEEARKAAAALEGKKRAAAEAAERERAAAAAAEIKRQEEVAAKARDSARAQKQEANVAKVDAGAKAADLSRSRSTAGSVASLRVTWHHEVVKEADVPREYLSVSDRAIKVAIAAATTVDNKCNLRIPGVRIFPKEESIVR
jgi:hypothetical protein